MCFIQRVCVCIMSFSTIPYSAVSRIVSYTWGHRTNNVEIKVKVHSVSVLVPKKTNDIIIFQIHPYNVN